jgi:hypothetical protein
VPNCPDAVRLQCVTLGVRSMILSTCLNNSMSWRTVTVNRWNFTSVAMMKVPALHFLRTDRTVLTIEIC